MLGPRKHLLLYSSKVSQILLANRAECFVERGGFCFSSSSVSRRVVFDGKREKESERVSRRNNVELTESVSH